MYVLFLEQRCDRVPHCIDSSDEANCNHIVLIDQSYDKTVILKKDREKVKCYLNLTILDVILIDDDNNFFKPKFQISIEWKDQGLKFQHLKKGYERLLSHEETSQIWNPNILLDDLNQINRYFL